MFRKWHSKQLNNGVVTAEFEVTTFLIHTKTYIFVSPLVS